MPSSVLDYVEVASRPQNRVGQQSGGKAPMLKSYIKQANETVDLAASGGAEQRGRDGDDVSPAALARLSAQVREKAVMERNDLVRGIRMMEQEMRTMRMKLEKAEEKVVWAEVQYRSILQNPPPE